MVSRLPVKNPLRLRRCAFLASILPSWRHHGHLTTGVHAMSDLLFVILTGAFFALASLILKGVERL
jgi:hypothetical protein